MKFPPDVDVEISKFTTCTRLQSYPFHLYAGRKRLSGFGLAAVLCYCWVFMISCISQTRNFLLIH